MGKRYRVGLGLLGLAVALAVALTVPLRGQGDAPELWVTMPEPYMPNVALKDDYRCFLIDLGLESDVFVTRVEVVAQRRELVHHAILFMASPGEVAQAQGLDRGDSGPGWTCFGGAGTSGGGGTLAGALATWVPGVSQTVFPEGTGKRVRAGTQLVLQLHYNLFGATQVQADQSGVRLTLAPPDSSVRQLREILIFAPVEVRCPGPYPKDTTHPCHRQHALAQLQNPNLANALHAACGTTPNQYIERDIGFGDAQDTSCDVIVRQAGQALGASNHMHLRGKSIKVELNPGTLGARVLLWNPNWNFNFQQGVWFEQPIPLTPGDVLRVTCVYDNSGPIPSPDGQPLAPRYLVWGEGTTDEMCLGGVTWVQD